MATEGVSGAPAREQHDALVPQRDGARVARGLARSHLLSRLLRQLLQVLLRTTHVGHPVGRVVLLLGLPVHQALAVEVSPRHAVEILPRVLSVLVEERVQTAKGRRHSGPVHLVLFAILRVRVDTELLSLPPLEGRPVGREVTALRAAPLDGDVAFVGGQAVVALLPVYAPLRGGPLAAGGPRALARGEPEVPGLLGLRELVLRGLARPALRGRGPPARLGGLPDRLEPRLTLRLPGRLHRRTQPRR